MAFQMQNATRPYLPMTGVGVPTEIPAGVGGVGGIRAFGGCGRHGYGYGHGCSIALLVAFLPDQLIRPVCSAYSFVLFSESHYSIKGGFEGRAYVVSAPSLERRKPFRPGCIWCLGSMAWPHGLG
jgi:hypothetical protein